MLAAFADAGARAAVVTAKDKLRPLLGHELRGTCFSAEKAHATTEAERGIADALALVGVPLPSVYSAALSEFVFAAGVKLMESVRAAAGPMGDLVIVSARDAVIGTRRARHDLSGLEVPLRSRRGLSEQRVPMIVNRPAPGLSEGRRLRNFDVFDVALNALGPTP